MRGEPATLALLVVTLLACGETETPVPPSVGTLEQDRVELVSEAFETITEVTVREGDRVRRGDVLVRLDPTVLDVRIERAVAERDLADATLRLAVRGPRRERIAEATAHLDATEGSLNTASLQLKRIERLVEQEVETPSALDSARARHDEALGRRDEARASLEALLEGTTLEELDQVRAQLAAAEAMVAELEIQKERLDIRTPVDGRVDALPMKLGARPAVGATVAVLLVDQPPYARVHVPAAIWQSLQTGAEADLHIDGQERTWRGRLRFIADDPSFTPYYALTRHDRGRLSYVAEVDVIDDADTDVLRIGATVEVYFDGIGIPE